MPLRPSLNRSGPSGNSRLRKYGKRKKSTFPQACSRLKLNIGWPSFSVPVAEAKISLWLTISTIWLDSTTPQKTRLIPRSEEHTSELQSRPHLVCRLLLEKKKK